MLRYDLLGEKRIAGGNSTQAFMKWVKCITRKDEPETTAKTPQKSTQKKMELRRETEEKRHDWQVYKVPHLPGELIW